MFDIITDREELKIYSIKDKIEQQSLTVDGEVIVLTTDGVAYTFNQKKFNKVMEDYEGK